MGDGNFKILLEAIINTSSSDINKQLKDVARQIEPLGISINIPVQELKRLDETLTKVSKTKFNDSGLEKIVETTNKRLGETVKTFKDIEDGAEKTKKTVESIDYGKQNKYLEQSVRLQEQIGLGMKKTWDMSKNYSGFIDEKELATARKLLSEINIDTDDFTTNLRDVEGQITKITKGLEKTETAAQKSAKTIRDAQVMQQIKKEDTVDKAHQDAILEDYKRTKKAQMDMDSAHHQAQVEDYKRIQKLQADIDKAHTQAMRMNEEYDDNAIKRQEKLAKQAREVELAKEKAYARIDNITKSNEGADVRKAEELKKSLQSVDKYAADAKLQVRELDASIDKYGASARMASTNTNSLSDSLKRMGLAISFYDVIQLSKRGVRELVSEVVQLDSSLVELRKVTNLNSNEIDSFTNSMYSASESVGRTGREMIDAVSTMSRAGYEINDAMKLGELSLSMANVGDNMNNVEENATTLISIMKAYGESTDFAAKSLDILNEVSNTQAITTSDLAEGLRRTSAVYNQSGVDVQHLSGLLVGANEVMQNIEKSSSGLITISQRLRQVSEAFEEDPENISKLDKAFREIAGIDIRDANGQIKDTYSILSDMARVFPTLTGNQRQFLSELAAGKRQVNVLQSLLGNWESVKKAVATAQSSQGSYLREQEVFLDSIQGKLNQFQSAWQQVATTSLSSDLVKDVVSLGTGFLKLIDACGGLVPILSSVGIAFAALKLNNMVGGIRSVSDAMTSMSMVMNGVTASASAMSMAMNILAGGLITAGLIGVTKLLDAMIVSVDEQAEKVGELKGKYEELNSEVERLKGLSEPTDADQTMLKYKELELEATRLLVEENEKLLVQKEMFGKGVWGDGEIKEIESLIYDAETLQSAINNVKKDIAYLQENNSDGKYDNDIARQEEHLASLYQDQIRITPELTQATDKLTAARKIADDKQKETIDTDLKKIDTIIAESDAISDLNKSLESTPDDRPIVVPEVPEETIRSFEELQKVFESTGDAQKDFDKMLEELDEYGNIGSESLQKIIEKYPQILAFVGNETKLREELTKTIASQKDEQIKAYNEMIMQQYATSNEMIDIDNDLYNSLLDLLNQYYTAKEGGYEGDLQAYADSESKKGEITEKLIQELNKAWATYFGTISTNIGRTITSVADLSSDDYANMDNLQKFQLQRLKQQGDNVKNTVDSILKDLSNTTIDIADIGNVGSKSKEDKKSSGDKKDKSEKENYAKYYSSLVDEKINIILKESERLADAEEMANAKLENAQLQGNDQLTIELQRSLIEMARQEKELTSQTAEELRVIGNQAIADLSNMKISGYEGFDFTKANELDIAKITQNFDKQINSSKDGTKAALEYQKAQFEDLIGIVTRIYQEELPDLSQSWWDSLNKQMQAEQKAIELEVKVKTVIFEDSEKTKKQLQDQLSIMADLGAGLRDQLDIRNQISDVQEDELRYLNDIIYSLEQRLQLETTTKAEQEAINDQLDELRDKQSSLLKDRISGIKEEAKLQAELNAYGNSGKSAWEESNKSEIDAIRDKINAIKEANKEKSKEEDIQKRILEIKEMELKLEELRRNKSIQTLKQNENGEWDFSYEVDEKAIEDLQNQINDKKDEVDKIEQQEIEDAMIAELEEKIKILEKEARERQEHYKQLEKDLFTSKANELRISQNENLKIQTEETNNMDKLLEITDTGLTNIQTKYEEKLQSTLESVKRYMKRIREEIASVDIANVDGGSGNSRMATPKTSGFATGGLNTKTGFQLLHGTQAKPERVLSAEQTKIFDKFVDIMPQLEKNISSFVEMMNSNIQKSTMDIYSNAKSVASNLISNNTNQTQEIHIGNISLPNVEDGNSFVDELTKFTSQLVQQSGLNLAK